MIFAYFCVFAGLAVLAVTIYFSVRNRHNSKKWLSTATAGIFFTMFFMAMPTEWFKEELGPALIVLRTLASSLSFGLKALAGRGELSQLSSVPLTGWQKEWYLFANYVLCIAAPILTTSWILALFGDTAEKIKYWFRFSRKCCVFSDLNESSLVLANSIKKERGRETIVFCNTKKADEKYMERARKIEGILLYKACSSVKPSRRFGSFEYYLISDEEDGNIRSAESIIVREGKRKRARPMPITVNTFYKNSTKIEVLEDQASAVIEKSKEEDQPGIQFRFINEIALFCGNHVFEHPLFDLPDGRKDISVMIVGCGSWGMQMLKTILCAGQIDGYSLKIRVYDIQADHLEGVFYRQCPEIRSLGADLQFIQSDVQTEAFYDEVKKNSPDATYVCVATSSDDTNLELSENLFRFFRRNGGYAYTPNIYVRIKNDLATANLTGDYGSYLQERKIELFGAVSSFYAEHTLFNTWLEKLALAVQLCYDDQLLEDKNSEGYKEAVNNFYKLEYNRKSSMAVALHLKAKMWMCLGGDFHGKGPRETDLRDEKLLETYRRRIKDEAILTGMTYNEHTRWNHYMACEGFRSVPLEDVKKYFGQGQTNSHKDEHLSKSHPCIVSKDELIRFQKDFNAWSNMNKDFVEYDRKICRMLPDIIREAENMCNLAL